MNKTFYCIVLIVFCSFNLAAQNGIIRGTVLEDSNGEPLFGVTVQINGTTTGAITDFEGKFDISIAPGSYELQASFVSFQTITISGLIVEAGEVTIIDQIRLKEDVELLNEVIVTAEVIKTTEAALLTVKRKSANLIDGISEASFKKIGDSDAADAVKRVTGVSIEGGKYVYVRGLGDRYTKTMLNGVDIPGLDPDRNSLQIDIFPTNIISNMLVMKTAVAELPADFTGGVVDIETKDFPDEKIFDVSMNLGCNPHMHFNSNNLTYEGGNIDFLGIDDGTRALPSGARSENIPTPISGDDDATVSNFLKGFNQNLGTKRKTSFMDYSVGLSLGNQISLSNGNKLGYVASFSYKNNTRYYDDVVYGEFQNAVDQTVNDLAQATLQTGEIGENNVLLAGLVGVAYKSNKSKFKLNALHLQNGENKSGSFFIDNDGSLPGQSGYFAQSNNLFYTERGLTNFLFNGQHQLKNSDWKVEWKLSPTVSKIDEPDIRNTAFTYEDRDTTFVAGAGGNPRRSWRYLDEINIVSKVDIDKKHKWFGRNAKLKFGVSQVYKTRDYEILTYDVQFYGIQQDFDADPNQVFNNANLYPNGTVYLQSGNTTPNSNEYRSNVNNSAFYVSEEFHPVERLKATMGLRAEYFVQRHTGRDTQFAGSGGVDGNSLDNDKVLDALDLFPSLNTNFSFTERQQLRFSFSKTIARPSFKELSFAQIIDPISNRIFNGGLFKYPDWDGNLTETRINNYDIRYEYFLKNNGLASISFFYKSFDDPIELVRIPAASASTEYQPRNVGDGEIYGFEIEFRKNLGFIGSQFSKLTLNGNFTFTKSIIEMTATEFNSRLNTERVGQNIDNKRDMAGQAPYILNAGIAYNDLETGLSGGFFYNVKGSTLYIVGGGLFPDVRTEPFHSLNFNFTADFGAKKNSSINFSIANILDDDREEFYEAFEAQDQIFTRFSPGVSFGLGYSYSF